MRKTSLIRNQFFALTLGLASVTGARAETGYPPLKIGLSTQIVAAGFELIPKTPGSISDKLKYRPAQSNYAGVILGYKWLAGTVSFSVPAEAKIRELEGTSQYRDYRLSYYTRRMGGEVAYSRYRGYLIENSSDLSAGILAGQTYYKLDLETIGYGANAFYLLSKSEYSLAAAIDQSEMQSRSDGAWLLLATYRHQYIQSPTTWIPDEKKAAFGADQAIRTANTQAFAAGGGYGYNWVPGRFFFSILAALTLGYQQAEYEAQAPLQTKSSAQGNLHFRTGLGYNSRHSFLTVNAYFDRFGQETESIELGNTIYGTTFAIGMRF